MRRSGSSGSSAPRTGKTIPQLGGQRKQSCAPLKVFTDIANNDSGLMDDIPEGYTLDDFINDYVHIEIVEVAFKYQNMQPLVKPDQLPLPTMMRRYHEWYMEACKDGTDN